MKSGKDATRARIVAAAEQVFRRDGVNASLELVAAEAGVSRATLFRLFDDRDALMVEIMEVMVARYEERAAACVDKPDGLARLLRLAAEEVSNQAPMVRYWRGMDPNLPAMRSAMARHREPFERALLAAKRFGHCRPDVDMIDISLLGSLFNASVTLFSDRERDEAMRRAWRMAVSILGLVDEGARRDFHAPSQAVSSLPTQ